MGLSINDIVSLDCNTIFEIIFPNISDIYNMFLSYGLTKSELDELVLKEIYKSKSSYKRKNNYIDYIKKNIRVSADKKIKKLLNSDEAFRVLNCFINEKLKNVKKYDIAILEINKICVFLDNYNYAIPTDVLFNLLNNNEIFNDLIKVIVDKKIYFINSGRIDEIFENNFFLSAIEIYCSIYGIEMRNNDENDDSLYKMTAHDSLSVYLNDISNYPLLTREQEVELYRRILNGDSLAKEKFINSNLKLVVSIAKRYIDSGIPMLDLIQDGNIGLMTAIEHFDPDKGFKFSTYATWWISQAISRGIAEKSRNIRIPIHMSDKLKIYKSVYMQLQKKYNREPKKSEIALAMNISLKEVERLYGLQLDTISLNAAVSDESEAELEDFIPDKGDLVEDLVINKSMVDVVKKLLKDVNLSDLEIKVLYLRYGFNGNAPLKLEKIGEIMNFTIERSRQIESKALKKIRRSKYIKELAIFTSNPSRSLENIELLREAYRHNSGYRAYLNNKTDLRDIIDLSNKSNKSNRKCKSIYDLLAPYSKDEIDIVISKIPENYKELLHIRYGEDLENPIPLVLSVEDKKIFYSKLIPKMRKMLVNPNTVWRTKSLVLKK